MGTVNTYLKTSKLNERGLAPVVLVLYDGISGKRREKSTGIRIAPSAWDNEKRRVKPSHRNSIRFNGQITKMESELNSVLMDVNSKRVELENKRLDELYDDGGGIEFISYAKKVHDEMDLEGEFSRRTKLKTTIKYLDLFFDHLKKKEESEAKTDKKIQKVWRGKKAILFSDFDIPFLEELEGFVLHKRKMSKQTLRIAVGGIKIVFQYAIKRKNVSKAYWNLDEYKAPTAKGEREFLSEFQLEALSELDLEPKSIEDLARDMYVFCGYGGGMRFGDVAQLKWMQVRKNILVLTTSKTNTPVTFPLPQKVLKILEKYRTSNQRPTDYVFPLLPEKCKNASFMHKKQILKHGNTRVCQALVSLGEKAGIGFRFRFHSSRHSFATIALKKGMAVTVLQKILGHGVVATTMRYIHLCGEDVKFGMEAYNQKIDQSYVSKNPIDQPAKEISSEIKLSMANFIRRYIESTASEMGVELTQVDGLALEMYEAMQQLPKESQQTIPVRVEAKGDLSAFEQTLTARSLFGEAVRFVVQPA